ncbi:MAG: MAE_28990/MAE_18760 family HEPN-like nuclease [Halobacteriota archaeon]
MSKLLLLSDIADNLDKRRVDFTNIRRVILKCAGGPLECTAVRMSVPMIYAVWEGYVKEVCQLYLEYVQSNVARAADLHPAVLGYMWEINLRPIEGGLNFARKKAIADLAIALEESSVEFPNKEINTKSNLKYEVLEDVANHLGLNCSSLAEWRVPLNSLVSLRNNIAHGASPKGLSYSNFDEYASKMLELMEAFEAVMFSAVENRVFCRSAMDAGRETC